MEQARKNPQQTVIAIIPARYSSERLPGKMLREIQDKPLILHTLEKAKKARTVDRVVVATDDERIFNIVNEAGDEAVMTSPDHQSGSDRIAEVAQNLPENSIVVNVQGDEPLISPDTIDAAVNALIDDPGANMATTCEPIENLAELLNGNNVKVLVGDRGYALHFSRSPIPWPREASLRYGGDPNKAIEAEPNLLSNFRKHTGLYVYRREYLLEFTKLPRTALEKFEMLEQLRALENGAKIKVVEAAESSIGVDTAEDLDKVRLKIEFPNISFRSGTAGDIPAISDAYVRSVRDSYRGVLPDEYLNDLSTEKRSKVFAERRAANANSYRLLIAEEASAGVIGFIDYAHKENANFDHDGRIFSFYFVPEFQRRGLGGLLFRNCLRRMRDDCYGSVCLDTFESNPFRNFYDKMGGRKIGSEAHEANGHRLPTIVYGWSDLSNI